jgi:hypothetical protein
MEEVVNINILVAEESSIVDFDIRNSLKNRGFRIIEKPGKENLKQLLMNKTPDLTITSVRSLTKCMPARDFYEIWRTIVKWKGNTDTIIFDKSLNPLAFYSKPFNTEEIIDFIKKHLNNNASHENV